MLISAHGLDELGDIVPDGRAAGFLPKTSLGVAAIEALLTHSEALGVLLGVALLLGRRVAADAAAPQRGTWRP